MSDDGLTEATQRVMSTLEAHAIRPFGSPELGWVACSCGEQFGFEPSASMHVAEAIARAAREDVADRNPQARADAWDEGARHGLLTADWEYGARVNQPDPHLPEGDPMSVEHPKDRAERESREEYRRTHSADGYALGSAQYPNNREGRRALARTWKRANR